MKKGGTGRCSGLGLDVSRGGAWTPRRCDNLRERLVGEGAGPNGTTNLERGVLEKGTGLSLYLRMRTMDLWKGACSERPAWRQASCQMRMCTVDIKESFCWESGRG